MSENTAPVEAPDPFKGGEPTYAEYDSYRRTGELPERFKETEPKKEEPPAPEGETAAGQEPVTTEQENEQERDEAGKFKAKPKQVEFTPEQQEAFDRAFRKREAKLRREYDEKIAALTSSNTQGTAPAKTPTAAPSTDAPQPPELPDFATWTGTPEDYSKALKEYPHKLSAFLDAKRNAEESQRALQNRLLESEKKAQEMHADYKEEFDRLVSEIQSGDAPALPEHVLKAIATETDDPHGLTYYLTKNREEYERFAALSPNQALREVLKLEAKLQLAPETAAPAPKVKPRQTAAPPAPELVGTRAAAKAFDANDDSIPADEWVRRRNAERQKAGHRV